jgi:hypothetical protein
VKSQLILGLVSLMVAIPAAYAATINVVEGPSETPPTISVSGFDIQTPDISVMGVENAIIGSPASGEFHSSSPDTDLTLASAFLLEPGSRVIGDRVDLTFIVLGGEASVIAVFTSDIEGGLGILGPGIPALEENGTLQDLTGSFVNGAGAPVALPEGLVINVQSDISEVPEPATTWLLPAGLLGLIAAGRRGHPRAA